MMKRTPCALFVASLLLPACALAAQHRNVDSKTARADDHAYTDVLNTLYSQGWHDISGLTRDGGVARATAIDKDGHRRTVIVDPSAGTVRTN